MPATSGVGRSEYSAKENVGATTQRRGTRKPIHASVSRTTSRVLLLLLTVLTARLRFPCGARMAIMTTLAARMTAFAIQGFIVEYQRPCSPASIPSDFHYGGGSASIAGNDERSEMSWS